MSDQLITHIRKFVQLTAEEAELISSKVTLLKLKKKACVLTPGTAAYPTKCTGKPLKY